MILFKWLKRHTPTSRLGVQTISKGTKRAQILLTDYQLVNAIYMCLFDFPKRHMDCTRRRCVLLSLNEMPKNIKACKSEDLQAFVLRCYSLCDPGRIRTLVFSYL